MLSNLFGTIIMLALAIMLYCVWFTFSLRKLVPGGVIGRNWSLLTALVLLFAAGYAVTPVIAKLSDDVLRIATASIFLFGAAYVLVTLRLMHSIIKSLSA